MGTETPLPELTVCGMAVRFLGRLLVAAGPIAAAATILGFLGRFWWFFDLFSHFRVQYTAGLTLVSVLLLVTRQWRKALLLAAFGAFPSITASTRPG